MKYDSIVIHYAEIGLKLSNRSQFERLLVDNIKLKCGNLIKSCVRDAGHITIYFNDEVNVGEVNVGEVNVDEVNVGEVNVDEVNVGEVNVDKVKDILIRIPGIAFFSFAKKCEQDLDEIKKCADDFVKDLEYESFKVDARRHNKNFKHTSMELNEQVGEVIFEKYNKKVKMKDAELILKIEISNKDVFISYEDIKGVGGLPTNPKQKVVALMSGGFDSPVASYLLMKRGCQVVLVHFNNKNQMSESVKDKIHQLAKQLSKYQIKTKLYIIQFDEIQKEIILKVHSTLRMLIYRKIMIKIASKIANKVKAKFLVTGDSLSQVASQTIDNLEATYSGSEFSILSPLIGLDKEEIIDISKKIGTYDISKLPYGDCCAYFLPKHPMLRADVKMLDKAMSEMDADKLIIESIENADEIVI